MIPLLFLVILMEKLIHMYVFVSIFSDYVFQNMLFSEATGDMCDKLIFEGIYSHLSTI